MQTYMIRNPPANPPFRSSGRSRSPRKSTGRGEISSTVKVNKEKSTSPLKKKMPPVLFSSEDEDELLYSSVPSTCLSLDGLDLEFESKKKGVDAGLKQISNIFDCIGGGDANINEEVNIIECRTAKEELGFGSYSDLRNSADGDSIDVSVFDLLLCRAPDKRDRAFAKIRSNKELSTSFPTSEHEGLDTGNASSRRSRSNTSFSGSKNSSVRSYSKLCKEKTVRHRNSKKIAQSGKGVISYEDISELNDTFATDTGNEPTNVDNDQNNEVNHIKTSTLASQKKDDVHSNPGLKCMNVMHSTDKKSEDDGSENDEVISSIEGDQSISEEKEKIETGDVDGEKENKTKDSEEDDVKKEGDFQKTDRRSRSKNRRRRPIRSPSDESMRSIISGRSVASFVSSASRRSVSSRRSVGSRHSASSRRSISTRRSVPSRRTCRNQNMDEDRQCRDKSMNRSKSLGSTSKSPGPIRSKSPGSVRSKISGQSRTKSPGTPSTRKIGLAHSQTSGLSYMSKSSFKSKSSSASKTPSKMEKGEKETEQNTAEEAINNQRSEKNQKDLESQGEMPVSKISPVEGNNSRLRCLTILVMVVALVGGITTVSVVWYLNGGAPLKWLYHEKNTVEKEEPERPQFTFTFDNGCDDPTTTCCNGLQSNCEQRLNEVIFPTVHKAMSSVDENFDFPHQNFKLELALDAGYRALTLGTCWCEDKLSFCDGTCANGSRNSTEVLNEIQSFLLKNENEVIVVHFNIHHHTLLELYRLLRGNDLMNFIYTHNGVGELWPTMETLINTNKRVVLFQESDVDCELLNCPKFVHPSSDYIDQSVSGFDSISDIENYQESCKDIGRGDRDFFLLNHFIEHSRSTERISDENYKNAKELNAYSMIHDRKQNCEHILGRRMNFLVVDFWEIGDTLFTAQAINL